MKPGTILLIAVLVLLAGLVTADRLYVSKFKGHFKDLEKERVVTSNKLATAKIVYENLNHVRDLVFKNMVFPGQNDTVSTETIYFDFLTSCVNDLKLKIVSLKTVPPLTVGNITTYGYDLELEGDFFKFGELCAKFENSRRIISVESFQVDLSEKTPPEFLSGGNKGIKVIMRVNIYRARKGLES
jgi:hypothetical protein